MERYEFGMSDSKTIFDGECLNDFPWPTDAQISRAAFRDTMRNYWPWCVGLVLSLIALLAISPGCCGILVGSILAGGMVGSMLARAG